MKRYSIEPLPVEPAADCSWDDPAWQNAPVLEIDQHRSESTFQPRTQAKLLYGDVRFHVIFRVEDQYVRSVRTRRNSDVCKDSCVEFFVEPIPGKGYFNFEFNCGGTMLLYYCTIQSDNFTGRKFDGAAMDQVEIHHSMPNMVEPEIVEPAIWTLRFSAPYALLETFVLDVPRGPGVTWRGNFFKCAGDNSHPHWASWSPLPGRLSFHRPECFGELKFA